MKKIQENIPIYTIALIFIGFLKLYFFYDIWDINILPYLEITEILQSFLDDITIIAFSAFIFIIYSLTIANFVKIDDVEAELFGENIKKFLLVAFIIMFICWIFYYLYQSLILLFVCLYFSWQFIFALLKYFNTEDNFNISFSVLVVFAIFSFLKAQIDAREIIRNAKNINQVYQFNDFKIETGQSNYLIGKTRNYLFFYESNTDSTTIYKDEIKKITIKLKK